jgi:4-hydroxyphenylpyruvate dioxygenase-like putative hemolysin
MRPLRFPNSAFFAAAAIALAPALRAENWVDTRHTTEVDVDSIDREADGLVYYMERYKYETDLPPARAAVDCRNRVSYSSYSIQYEPDWRSKGVKVTPGTMGAELLDFVCTRVK